LKKYQDASLKTSTSLATLNFGQNVIFSGALSIIMIMAANQIAAGMSIAQAIEINTSICFTYMEVNMEVGY